MIRHLALFGLKSPYFEPHQVITHIFMHGSFGHLFFNMFAVFMFGRVLEGMWGSKKMLIFYTLTGLGAASVHLLINYVQTANMIKLANEFYSAPTYEVFNAFVSKYASRLNSYEQILAFAQEWFYQPQESAFISESQIIVAHVVDSTLQIPTVGASGAVFGLLIAFAMLFPDVELMLIFLPIPIKAKYFVPAYALIELFFGVANFSWDNVAHFAHLGGALFGFIIIKYWQRNQFKRID